MALFGRKDKALTASALRVRTLSSGRGALTAAAYRVPLGDRHEAARQMRLRQGWQLSAWAYRDSIGELRYALNFLANCAARMKIFPAAYPLGGEMDNPVALSDLEETVPAEVITGCQAAMKALGNGRMAISQVMHALSTNQGVAGECFLLGQTDPETGRDEWSIRSVAEIQIKDDRYYLREVPTDNQGILGAVELDPDLTVISRIWRPHPQWRLLADSPLRAMQDDCESLLIYRRMIRAVGRSRIAGRGLLLIPEELELKSPNGDNMDPESDDFLGSLGEMLMMPLDNEGAASAVVPGLIRGKAEALKEIRLLEMGQNFDGEAAKVRDELVGVIATTLDLPKEVVTGTADLNHWSAWQVDDNTFRHHVEPDVIHDCDCLTGAFLRPFLEDEGVDPEWVDRLLFWYDPTELVTHPDQTKDALDLHDRLVISNEALLTKAGFAETDAPSVAEFQVRLLHNMRQWPPNVVAEFLHQLDPSMTIPPITVAGTVPGIKPSGVDTGEPVGLPGPGQTAGTPAVPPAAPKPSAEQPTPAPPAPAVTAAAAPEPSRPPDHRLSRKLVQIDRDLRIRLQTAANAAMLRQLERAGARLRSKVAKDETMRSKIAHRANERAAAYIGEQALTAAGLTATDLLSGDWSGLRSQFHQWVSAAQKQALAVAAKLGGLSPDAVQEAADRMAPARDTAWGSLESSLSALSEHLLYSPDPNASAGEWGDSNPDTLVPTGTIRASLAVAGGAAASAVSADDTGALSVSTPLGQIGTGDVISGLLSDAGGEVAQFTWVHGPSLHPFEPHEDLDGVEFASFDDDALANPDSFPDNAYFMPGDHAGCSCDFQPLWDFPGNPMTDSTDEGEQ